MDNLWDETIERFRKVACRFIFETLRCNIATSCFMVAILQRFFDSLLFISPGCFIHSVPVFSLQKFCCPASQTPLSLYKFCSSSSCSNFGTDIAIETVEACT